ncbi:hypothetical protein P3T36_001450 [Kitasatospora sp. MAP12-15]|uniref:hypothetical protein n=1 Tax=unclassified Kitasatospora TaxID=2633591 RepID=UPI002473CCBA|nr:hypothetical protein [Kitasatospora sp. MAP12-44]MDH6112568.1 hypothetical protein [Kitasatospora sp. MAP12-44]
MGLFTVDADLDEIYKRCEISDTEIVQQPGGEYDTGAVIPRRNWMTLSQLQTEVLCGVQHPERAVEIIHVPLEVMNIAAGAHRYHGNAALPDAPAQEYLGTVTNQADMLTTTLNDTSGSMLGLHLDNWDRLPYGERYRSRRRLCVNLGPGSRWLLVCDHDSQAIVRNLYPDAYLDRVPHTDDVRAFVAAGKPLTCVRIRIDAGEGYLAPTDVLPHDGSMEDLEEPSTAAFWLGHWASGAFPVLI